MFALSCRSVLGLLAGLACFAPAALAQDEYSRFEVGGEFAAFRASSDAQGNVSFFPGLGVRFAYNFSRRLAFETELDGVPQGVPSAFLTQGGSALSTVFGVRAKVLQSQHFAVFGLLRPGLLRFSSVADRKNVNVEFHPNTFFVLNLGGGVEYYPSPRWILRFDITGNPYRIPNSTQQTLTPSGTMTQNVPGEINDQFRLTFGMAYRLGKLRENVREDPVSSKWEFGPQFTTTMLQRRASATGVQTEPGAGAVLSYQLFRFLHADGAVTYYPRGSQAGFQDGGTLLQAVFGLKGGIRRDHLGFFGKFRPGLVRSSNVVTGFQQVTVGGVPEIRETLDTYHTFAIDFGGVIEVYAAKRQLLRFDLGDTHLYYHTTFINNADGTVTTLPGGRRQHSIQMSVAYAWRF